MKVFSVAGLHHTGKTTVVVDLIGSLKRKGYRVVSIKDIHAENFSMEKAGSNTWRHWEASNDTVFARGLNETYQIWHRRLDLNEMLAMLAADYVIVEGMRSAPLPRIICAKNETQLIETVDDTVFAVSGIYGSNSGTWKGIPVLDSKKDLADLTTLVEEKVFEVLPAVDENCCTACGLNCREMVAAILAGKRKRTDCRTDSGEKIKLIVDEKEVKIVPFVQNTISDVIKALIRNLKGCEKGNIKLEINDRNR